MRLVANARARARRTLTRVLRPTVLRIIDESAPVITQLLEFHQSKPVDRMSHYNRTDDPLGNHSYFAGLKDSLVDLGVPVEGFRVDLGDFERWLDDFPAVATFYRKVGSIRIEKCLEHYLAYRILDIGAAQCYVDLAACESPWAGILRGRGQKAYRLDMRYPKGIHGYDIGADASETRLPAGFASALSCQCAFECFAGNADQGFVIEADRILDDQGRYAILPLYLDDAYYVALSPHIDQRGARVEDEARKVWRDDGRHSPFSRHYSPTGFKRRILDNVPASMDGKVLFIENLDEIMGRYPGQRVYCYFVFVCRKRGSADGR